MGELSVKMKKAGHVGGYIEGGDEGTWFPRLWTWAIERFRIRSFLDVGCGEGHAAKFFQERGCEVFGIEGCQEAIDHSAIPGQVALHDFTTGAFVPPRAYELVWSCEFLEHVDARYVPNIMATFARAGKMILLTHGLPGQPGHHHVNCRPNSYWIRQIERLGFECHLPHSLEARTTALQDNNLRVNFFARSGLVFVRTGSQPAPGLWGNIQRLWQAKVKGWQLNRQFFGSSTFKEHKQRCWQARRALRRAG